ncbi:hypothetical protein DESUT3_35170 [Desulfuromonas versatilis]|uniref:MJ1316 RNA cyclic group end recognition domain-containing protein n=1 Tax=Desulfuromonas versatilis TaxID=2802975 RepID=A0ABM8I0B5_9BACT|nr:DUF504 domain-containing protein [Desulfuromonas versatilis]BCR06448.1 hypothetical protein DESUT3_35170 [Desulfuromonas versatilis]
MQPVQEILNRIRWDPEFGDASFEIGYYDRLEDEILRVPFERLEFPEGEHFVFRLVDPWGEEHSIPFHRVYEIWRNGVSIWHRERH